MARFRGGSIRPVQRIKHVVDSSGTLGKGVEFEVPIVSATDTPSLADTDGVITGAKVNGIYLKIEVAANEIIAGVTPNVYLAVWKNPGGNLTSPTPVGIGSNDNKRYVIHQEMILINATAQNANPRVLFNGVIVILKGMRRFGPNDVLSAIIQSENVGYAVCLQAHYKEFR